MMHVHHYFPDPMPLEVFDITLKQALPVHDCERFRMLIGPGFEAGPEPCGQEHGPGYSGGLVSIHKANIYSPARSSRLDQPDPDEGPFHLLCQLIDPLLTALPDLCGQAHIWVIRIQERNLVVFADHIRTGPR